MLSKNKEYVVDIVDIGQGGVGIGKYEFLGGVGNKGK